MSASTAVFAVTSGCGHEPGNPPCKDTTLRTSRRRPPVSVRPSTMSKLSSSARPAPTSGTLAEEGADPAVEHDVLGALVSCLPRVERLVPAREGRTSGIELSLHHVVFAVDARKAVGRLDQDEAIHTIGDVEVRWRA